MTEEEDHDQHSNLPISEQFRVVAKKWVDADRAASLMEETKTAVFAEMTGKLLMQNISMAVNRAETVTKSSSEWKEFVTEMVRLRSRANLLKVQMEYIRMKFQEQSSREATARAEMKL